MNGQLKDKPEIK